MQDSQILKSLREDKRLSQQKLADIIGVSKQYISLVEINRAKMSEDFLGKLKKFYPDYIPSPSFDFPDQPTPDTIKSFREAYKLTQSDLSKMLFCKTSFVSHYEQGLLKDFPLAYYELMKQYVRKDKSMCKLYFYSLKECKPTNNFLYFDNRLFDDLHCEYTYIIEMFDNSLAPDYYKGDKLLVDSYYQEFMRGYKTLFMIGETPNIAEFYDGIDKPKIIGRVVPKVRF